MPKSFSTLNIFRIPVVSINKANTSLVLQILFPVRFTNSVYHIIMFVRGVTIFGRPLVILVNGSSEIKEKTTLMVCPLHRIDLDSFCKKGSRVSSEYPFYTLVSTEGLSDSSIRVSPNSHDTI